MLGKEREVVYWILLLFQDFVQDVSLGYDFSERDQHEKKD
jgi:hypothetical protein